MVKKLQYQSVSKYLAVPPVVAQVIYVFSAFSQPAPINAVPAHQQPQVNFEITPPPQPTQTPDGLVFSAFEQPRFSTAVRPEQQPQPAFEIRVPPQQTLVFSTFSQPAPIAKVATHLQPQPNFEIGFLGPASTPSWLSTFAEFSRPAKAAQAREGFTNAPQRSVAQSYVFGRFEQPGTVRPQQSEPSVQFAIYPPVVVSSVVVGGDFADFDFQPKPSRAAQQDFTNAPFYIPDPANPTPTSLSFPQFESIVFNRSFPAYRQPDIAFSITPPPPSPVTVPVFMSFDQPAPLAKLAAHFQPTTSFEVLPPARQTLVFSSYSQPPALAKFPAHLQPQPSTVVGYPGPANTAGPLVFTPFDQPKFGPVIEGELTAAPIFEIAPPPQQTLVFTSFSQPAPLARLPAHLYVQPTYQVGYPGPANTPGPLVFSRFEPPKFSTAVPAHLQPQVAYQVGISTLPAPTPSALVFSEYAQPRFSTSYLFDEQASPLFEVLRPGAATPPQLVYSEFSQPQFYKLAVKVEQQPPVTFYVNFVPNPANPTPSALVFPPFDQPFFRTGLKPWLQPDVTFRTLRPTAATPTALVFSTFSQPSFRGNAVPAYLQPDVTVRGGSPPPVALTPTSLVFSTFSQPAPLANYKVHLHTQPDQEIGIVPPSPIPPAPPPPPASGSSRKLDKRIKTGLEPVKRKRLPPEDPVAQTLPTPPFADPAKPVEAKRPLDLIDRSLIPDNLLGIEGDMLNAQDVSDILAFLKTLDDDEQDVADIMDVLSVLDLD